MPTITTTRAALDIIEATPLSLSIDPLLHQADFDLLDATLISTDFSFTNVTSTRLDLAAGGFKISVNGTNFGPVGTIAQLEAALDSALATGSFSSIVLTNPSDTPILTITPSSAGYSLVSGNTVLTIDGSLPASFEEIADLFDALDALVVMAQDTASGFPPTIAARDLLLTRLEAFSLNGFSFSQSGTELAALSFAETALSASINGLTLDVTGSFLGDLSDWASVYLDLAVSVSGDLLDLSGISATSATLKTAAGDVLATGTELDVLGPTVIVLDGVQYSSVNIGSEFNDYEFFPQGSFSALPQLFLTGAGDDDLLDFGANPIVAELGDGNDRALGGDADDDFSGGIGNDILAGWKGDDRLDGGEGDDTLIGGENDDTIIGGSGEDVFIFDLARPTGVDVVEDYVSGNYDIGTKTITGDVVYLEGSATNVVQSGVDLKIGNVTFMDAAARNFVAVRSNVENVALQVEDGNQNVSDVISSYTVEIHDFGAAESFSLKRFFLNADFGAYAQEIRYDSGLRIDTDFDAAGSETWNTIVEYFNAGGGRYDRRVNYDDSSQIRTLYDADNANTWETIQEYRNTANALYDKRFNYDDGTQQRTLFDTDLSQTWSNVQEYRNALNELFDKRTNYDDGSQLRLLFDVASEGWDTIQEYRDASDRLYDKRTNYDTGTQTRTVFDVDDSESWTSIVELRNATNDLFKKNVNFDNGNYQIVLYDVDNTESWDIYARTFDNGDNLLSAVFV